jgi:hypothetical protein
MHHSTHPKRTAVALAHYIDDSGTHDDSPVVVMGGPVFLQQHFFEFHYEWSRILARHGIKKPIHMIEFNQYGYLAYLSPDERRALFQDLVLLINSRKLYSLTVEIDNIDFQSTFQIKKYRGLIGPASLAFFQCMILDSIIARDHNEGGRTAYLVAHSPHDQQMVDAHAFLVSYAGWPKRKVSPVGALAFDTPQSVNALQAADMIAWANRNNILGKPFVSGFEPLERLTRTVETEARPSIVHMHNKFNPDLVKSLGRVLGDPVRRKGKREPLFTLPPFDSSGSDVK